MCKLSESFLLNYLGTSGRDTFALHQVCVHSLDRHQNKPIGQQTKTQIIADAGDAPCYTCVPVTTIKCSHSHVEVPF
jgi:pyrrolidone-carboxylate peptidase